MNVLSLFDGISCGRIALDRANIKVDQYFASEIDRYAIKVSQHNYHNTIQLGDVTKINLDSLPQIDLLMGGSPCQGFSTAGKHLNFDDPRSKLFFEYVRVLNYLKVKNPNIKFLLENVVMKKEHQKVISDQLGVLPIMINSSLVSAQSRKRLYWTNIDGVIQPEDRKIKLSDIIQEDYDAIWVFPRGNNQGGLKNYGEKSPTVTSSSFDNNFLIYRGGDIRTFPRYKSPGVKRCGRLEIRKDDKSNCITTVDNTALLVKPDGFYRKFSSEELELLQTIPVGYTSVISKTQRNRCIGNGWTVDVIAHILSFWRSGDN